MIKRKELKDIILQLGGNVRKQVMRELNIEHIKNMFPGSGTKIVAYAGCDLIFLRIFYTIEKPRIITLREVTGGDKAYYSVSTGTFDTLTPYTIKRLIPLKGIITKVQAIVGLKIYREPGQLRREANICGHKLYISTYEDCYEWLEITDQGIKIEAIKRTTGVPYSPSRFYLGKKGQYELVSMDAMRAKTLCFKD